MAQKNRAFDIFSSFRIMSDLGMFHRLARGRCSLRAVVLSITVVLSIRGKLSDCNCAESKLIEYKLARYT